MQRTILGLLAIALFLSAVALWLSLPNAGDSISFAFCWRAGAMVAAAWLAYNDVQRLPNWLLATTPVLLIVLVRWPRYAVIVFPVVLVMAFLYSRFARR
jgi:hypothetical protein